MLIHFSHQRDGLRLWMKIVSLMKKEYDLLDFDINDSHFMHGKYLDQTVDWLRRAHQLTVRTLEFPQVNSMTLTVIEIEENPALTAFILKLP